MKNLLKLNQHTAVTSMMLAAILLIVNGLAAQDFEYPETRSEVVTDTYFGKSVDDPYRWLEDLNHPEVTTWAQTQDRLSRDYVADVPVRDVLEERLLSMAQTGRVGTPTMAGGKLFYTKTDPDSLMPQVFVRRPDGSDQLFYRVSKDFDMEEKRFRGILPSPTGKHIVFHEGQGQARWRHLRVMDAATKKWLPERLKGYYSGRGQVSWLRDGSGFFYTRYEEPTADKVMETTVTDSRVYFHKLGTPQSEDELIFRVPDEPAWLFWARVTLDGRYLVITEANAPETRIFVKDLATPGSEVKPLIDEADASFWFEGNEGSIFAIRTTYGAPNSRIVHVNVDNPARRNWREVIAERHDADLTAVSQVGGRLIVRYSKDSRPFAVVHRFSGEHLYDVELPTIGLIGGFMDDDAETTFYRFNSLFDPGSVYSLDVATGESELFARPRLSFDPDNFEMNQVFYRSKDGTRVPMFIASRRGLPKSAENPLFLYGYGAYKWAAFPWYQPHVLAWMELGGVYALPGIRGGGEYGEDWYQAGIRLNKQNGIDDFIAAARYLISEGYTSSDGLVANGGSASGVIAGAAVIQEPELFGAALIDVPAMDMLRYHKFGSGYNWIGEFGSSDVEEQFKVLRAYSPYHNVEPGRCYPPTLTTVGEVDDTTAPLHGYKFVAALQSADCANPQLLKVMWGAAHATSYGNTPKQRADNGADLIAFLVKVLEIDGRGALPSAAFGSRD